MKPSRIVGQAEATQGQGLAFEAPSLILNKPHNVISRQVVCEGQRVAGRGEVTGDPVSLLACLPQLVGLREPRHDGSGQSEGSAGKIITLHHGGPQCDGAYHPVALGRSARAGSQRF